MDRPEVSLEPRKKRKKPKRKKKPESKQVVPQTFWYTAALERQKRRSLTSTQQNSDAGKLKLWFSSMTPEQRRSVMSIVDPDLTYILICMYEKKRTEKEGYFFEVGLHDIFKPLTVPTRNVKTYRKKITPQPRTVQQRGKKEKNPSAWLERGCMDDYFMTKDFSLRKRTVRDDNFCFAKFSCLNSDFVQSDLREGDKMLEKQLRICDTKEYMDTLTLDMRLLKDPELFFYIMNIASRGNFLKSPCKVSVCQNERKKWEWEKPSWFLEMGFYTFATFIEQRLETHLWMRYWQAHGIDPRRNRSGPEFKFSPNQLQGLSSKEHLVEFWSSQKLSQRKAVLGHLGSIVHDVLMESRDIESYSYQKLLSILLMLGVTNQLAKNRDAQIATPPSVKQDAEWIDFLFFSPLPRVDTHMDVIIRRIGVYVQTAYADKSSTDLILGEENERRVQAKKNSRNEKKATLNKESASKTDVKSAQPQVKVQIKEPVSKETKPKESCKEIPKENIIISKDVRDISPKDKGPARDHASIKERDVSPKKENTIKPNKDSNPPSQKERLSKELSKISKEPKECTKDSPRDNQKPLSFSTPKESKSREASSPKDIPSSPQKSSGAQKSNKPPVTRAKSCNETSKLKDGFQTKSKETLLGKSKLMDSFKSFKDSSDSERVNSTLSWREVVGFTRPLSDPKNTTSKEFVRELSKSQEVTKSKDVDSHRKGGQGKKKHELRAHSSVDTKPQFTDRQSEARSHESRVSKSQPSSPKPVKVRQRRGSMDKPNTSTFYFTDINSPSRKIDFSSSNEVAEIERDGYRSRSLSSPIPYLSLTGEYIYPNPFTSQSLPDEMPQWPRSYLGATLGTLRTPADPEEIVNPVDRVPIFSPARFPETSWDQSVPEQFDDSFFEIPLPAYAHIDPIQDQQDRGRRISSPRKDSSDLISDKRESRSRAFLTEKIIKSRRTNRSLSPPRDQSRKSHSKPEKKKRARSISPSKQRIFEPYYSEIIGTDVPAVNQLHHLQGVDTLFAQKLHQEILQFQEESDRIMNERKWEIEAALEEVQQIVKSSWPKARVEVFGSQSTNLSLPSSDLDLVVLFDSENDEIDVPSRLRRLTTVIQKSDRFGSVRCLDTASVPVIKLLTKYNLSIDISIPSKVSQHSGTKAKDLILYFLSEYPEIRPIALVLKYFLNRHALNNPYTGGIGSYCLLLMIISFFQLYYRREHIPDSLETETSEERTGEEKANPSKLGTLFMEFLELYGKRFCYERIVIAVLAPDGAPRGSHRLIPPASELTSNMTPLLISDPFNPQNNIGHSTFMMWKVKMKMEAAFTKPQDLIPSLLQHMIQEEQKRKTCISFS